ncbi:MAG: hypothetical protein IT440_15000 [Phycisphaeraceae bacterium]|nr:hypothetical protein [Phycisphaeraceae bacterium]
MNRNGNSILSLLLIVFILVCVAASLTAVLIAVQRPVVVIVQSPPAPATVASQAATVAPTALPAAAPDNTVIAGRLANLPAVGEVDDPAWASVNVLSLDLLPQQTAPPMLDSPTVPRLRIQAAHDGRRIAWRLAWSASQPATQVETSTFTDAVAIQFPLVDGAPFTMGAKGKPVAVLHWKALWQTDLDQGFQDVHKLYPNAHGDLYWFAQGGWPYPIREAFKDPMSRNWLVGVAAGNPMSMLDRVQPVEELVAEGFGSSTTVPRSPSAARGRWRDGEWVVVIDRPLEADDSLAVCLTPGKRSQIAFAVWDGHAGNVASRKHYIGWVPFKVEP